MSNTGKKLDHGGYPKFEALAYVRTTKFKDLINTSIADLWDRVRKASDEDFCILFMLALLNTFLAPSRSEKVDTSFLIDLMDHEKIKELDWCSFVADYLINSIRAYQQQKIKDVPGCLHLLHVSSKSCISLHAAYMRGLREISRQSTTN
ncbi:hypothetical protein SEVIR_7G280875v4 [Setaria viridis]